MRFLNVAVTALAGVAAVVASTCPTVKHTGKTKGEYRNVSDFRVWQSIPAGFKKGNAKAILHITDIFGIPVLENRLLADSFAASNYLTVTPDVFRGDAIPVDAFEGGLDLTQWLQKHPLEDIEKIMTETIKYMKKEFGVTKIAGVGYCFGGKYVPRFMANRGIDVGFVAHPSNLQDAEIEAVAGPLSFAAGQLDASFNATGRAKAEDILTRKDATFQINLYSKAPHGFAVRPNMTKPVEVYAKEASFLQALEWIDAWL